MTSPAKKRKLNNQRPAQAPSAPSRGIEFFFKRQQQAAEGRSGDPLSDEGNGQGQQVLDDETLARRLQAEWNAKTGPVFGEGAKEEVPPKQPEPLSPDKASPAPEPILGKSPQAAAAKTSSTVTLSLQSISTTELAAVSSLPLDQSPLVFDPSDHVPTLRDAWGAGDFDGTGFALYSLLVRCFTLVNATTSRIKIVDTLVNCLRLLIETDPKSLLPAVWLTTNAIGPPYESFELGIGSAIISKALKTACGLDNRTLKSLYDRLGDPGDVAFEARKKAAFTLKKPKPLTIKSVYDTLVRISKAQGKGSTEVKQRLVDRLLLSAGGGEESRYVVRTLCQNLRIGAVRATILIALSRAFLLSRPPGSVFQIEDRAQLKRLSKESVAALYSKAEEAVKATFARRPNYDDLITALLSCGSSSPSCLADACGPKTHIPIIPMLGSPTRDLSEVVSKVGTREFAAECKYDGQRAQLHYSVDKDGTSKTSIFSRHLENITAQYPDITSAVPSMLSSGHEKPSSFVLEGEIVAISPTDPDKLLPFQTLSTRARKAIDGNGSDVAVCLFAFDLMFLNGEPLLAKPLRERRDLLRTRFAEIPGRFRWVRNIDAKVDTDGAGMDTVMEFFKEAVAHKCEGLMVKLLDPPPPSQPDAEPSTKQDAKPRSRRKPLPATYHPDQRVDAWLKVKKDYDASAADTLDLIPIAAWHGNGRKAKWWSPILLAVRRDEDGVLEAVCKCMSGFTDKVYKEMREFYNDGEGIEEQPAVSDEQKTSRHEEPPASKSRNTLSHRPALVEYYGPEPDVWFNPCEVWEIAFADITLSPTYTAAVGLVSEDRGLSLRFPRYLKRRLDKGLDEASSNSFLAALYRKQVAREAKETT